MTKSFTLLFAITAFVIAASGSAFAADMAVKALPPAVAPAYSWTGFYIGGNGGVGWSNRGFSYAANDPASAFLFLAAVGGQPPSGSFRTSGGLGGFQFGYNWQFNRQWLAGLEADFDFANVKGSASGQAVLSGPVTATLHEQLRDFGTLRARLGFLPTDSLLVYATGGLAYGKLERDGNYTMTSGAPTGVTSPSASFICFAGTPCFNGAQHSWEIGWTAGGGIELLVAPRWTFKAEYLYAYLNSKSVTETATAPFPGFGCCSTFNANFSHANFNIMRVGLNYQFH